ncbi:MAG: hypothetical protein R3Y10_10080 [Ferrimonas sp.]
MQSFAHFALRQSERIILPYAPLFAVLAVIVCAQFEQPMLAQHFPVMLLFLRDVAPQLLLLSVMLACIQHAIDNWLIHDAQWWAKRLPFSLNAIVYVVLFGCSQCLLLLQGREHTLNGKQRLALLTLCVGSAGGLSCLALSAVGYPWWHLALASLLITVITAVCMAPLLLSRKQLNPLIAGIKPSPFRPRLQRFLNSGAKLAANKAFVIAFLELSRRLINVSDDWHAIIISLPNQAFQLLGFAPESASLLAQEWMIKTALSRDMAMITLVENGIYASLTFSQQLIVSTLFISIIGTSTVMILTLNLFSMFGRNSVVFLKSLPLACLLAMLLPLIPLALLAYLG